MYEVLIHSARGTLTLDLFNSYEAAEEQALLHCTQNPHETVSIVETSTGKQVFVFKSAA
jgi:hypothetical protein